MHLYNVKLVGWGWLLRVKDQVIILLIVGRPSQLMNGPEQERENENKNTFSSSEPSIICDGRSTARRSQLEP